MSDFKEQIAKVKEAYNIVELVEEENVRLNPSGHGEYKGLCPFHSESTPSFKVSEPFQNYYCFGCHEKGDIVTFIQNTRGYSWIESLKYLAENKGIELDLGFSKEDDDGRPKVNIKELYQLVEDSKAFYRNEYNLLDDSHPAKKEIINRGLDPSDDIYCYAPERYGALYNHLKEKGYSNELMLASELVAEKDGNYFDFFYGRLLFTLTDFRGKPISYSSRKLFEKDTRGKYVNGKASPVFEKKNSLFNIHNAKKMAREEKFLILNEGQFDVMAFMASGLSNAVASSGTAFTEGHLKSARQLVGQDGRLIFAYDGDKAGIKAALNIFVHFPQTHGTSDVILFPENSDPCDYYMANGKEGMHSILDEKIPMTDFVIKVVADQIGIDDMSTRYKFVQIMTDKFLPAVEDPILLEHMLRRTSVMSGVDINKIRQALDTVKAGNSSKFTPKEKEKEEEVLDIKIPLNSLDDSDNCYITALSLLASSPEVLAPKSKGKFFPDKFKPFMKELMGNYSRHAKNGTNFRFIPEEYDDTDFAKHLQNTVINQIAHDSTDDLINHYELVLNTGEMYYKKQEEEQNRANILNAMKESKNNKELYQLLKTLENNK